MNLPRFPSFSLLDCWYPATLYNDRIMRYVLSHSVNTKLNIAQSKKIIILCTTWWYGSTFIASNNLVSPSLLLWKFCGNSQFPQSFGRFVQNCAFSQSFHTRKLGEILVILAFLSASSREQKLDSKPLSKVY